MEFIVKNRDQWDTWRDLYRRWQSHYDLKAASDPVAGRMAAYFAVLTTTAAIAHKAGVLIGELKDPIAPLWKELTEEAREGEVAVRSLAHVLSWATAHQAEFWGRARTDRYGARVPGSGWAGYWEPGDGWSFMGFLTHRLEEVLVHGGFEPGAVLRIWRDREWLLRDSEGRPRHQVRIYGARKWVCAR